MLTIAKGAAEYVPNTRDLKILSEAVQSCHGCELYRSATQAVFGERLDNAKRGRKAAIMMIGEQPGDKEDIAGHPFVGPAGKLLAQCLKDAEIDPEKVYITNAVKHFKWEPRGKIRLHKKPTLNEVRACKPWLDAELSAVTPKLIVCLGATAAQSLLGAKFRVFTGRGKRHRVAGLPPIVVTVHPASILRAVTDRERHRQTEEFIADLRRSHDFLRAV